MATKPENCPSFGGDLWSDDVLVDPYPTYRELRDLGPVVWLEQQEILAFPRFDESRAALSDWKSFSSATGVSVDEEVNQRSSRSILTTDPPEHDQFRKPMTEQLSVAGLSDAAELIEQRAAHLAESVATGEPFDGVSDLARPYSLHIVCDLIGLPLEGREAYPELAEQWECASGEMVSWAAEIPLTESESFFASPSLPDELITLVSETCDIPENDFRSMFG